MPSGREKRRQQQRARRAEHRKTFPWDSPEDLEMRKARLALLHKSRIAARIKAVIMCTDKSMESELDEAVCKAFRKYREMVDFEFRKCVPTFAGMPDFFFALQQPTSPGVNAKPQQRAISCTISHVSAALDRTPTRFDFVKGYESHRRAWPDYRRSAFTMACAFDRSGIVRALIVDFDCSMGCSNLEHGIVLIDQNGGERDWGMTGFDLAIEFGCLRTLQLLFELEPKEPSVTFSIRHANISRDDCYDLCKKNVGNTLNSAYKPHVVLGALRLWTDNECECDFCSEKHES